MRTLAAALAAAVAVAAPCAAQNPRVRTESVTVRRDTLRTRADSARADSIRTDSLRRSGALPTAPSRQFPGPDSIIQELLRRRGYRVTRYAADSVRLLAEEKEIRLAGQGLISREGSTLEADTVRYVESSCLLVAAGEPRLFDPGGNLTGRGMRYDACNHAGIVENAKTEMAYGSGKWLLHGDIAVDNQEDRIYASHATITSCDLTDPHYVFASRQVKWVNKRLMVSRPAVLYVADVPILWLPFIFQDTRHGRRSGVLAPQFGINDIVRFNAGYTRHITNMGYYFALSDFTDAELSMDWYASKFTTLNGQWRYKWLNRFMEGNISYREMHEFGGLTSREISWNHTQQFSLTSQLTAFLDYATSSRIISRNAVDPILATGTIDSRLNYQRRFGGGTLNLGGSRTQYLDKPEVRMSFPTMGFTPRPIAIGSAITWSPSFQLSNALLQHGGTGTPLPVGPGLFDSLRTSNRNTSLSVTTPIRIGQWNVNSGFSVADEWSNARDTATDSTGALITYGEHFQSGFDWNAGIGLPVLYQGRWNFQPNISMVNTAGGPFLIRNTYTGGSFVAQSKRFQFGLGMAPTLFGLFPGFGPVTRFRHALSPIIAWAYAPAADIPLEYALAIGNGRLPANGLTQPARQTLSLGLSQNIEAKLRAPQTARTDSTEATPPEEEVPGGVTPPEGRKIKLLSIQSGSIGYDFEQAKQPGRNGWTTQVWTNTISSDLVRGFTMNFAHDLWAGRVGYDSTRFSPMLTSMTFGFSVGAGSLNLVRRFLGLTPVRLTPAAPDTVATTRSATDPARSYTSSQRGPISTQYSSTDRLTPVRGGGGFQAQLNYSLQRSRATGTGLLASNTSNSMVSGSMQFSPTQHWTVSWQTSYNFTQGQFAEHVVRLDRDLHDWRATFTFVKSPNGNFLFNFQISLIDEPDIRFPYDQRNIR